MNYISQTSSTSPQWESIQEPKERIRLQIYPEPCSPEIVVNNLASIEGSIDIYCWYEGPLCLPKLGANFMKKFIFEPLYQLKQDTKIYLYSLKAWDFKNNIAAMPSSTPLGKSINRINKTAIECLYSSSFFQYSSEIEKEDGIYKFLYDELPKKKWLFDLSKNRKKVGTTVSQLFNGKISLFDCINHLDVAQAYSLMQYVEGYYLIRESVRKAFEKERKKIQIAFVLPNDESKYYLDYPKDIEKMLQIDFGKQLSDVDIDISFQFFKYEGLLDAKDSRPYIDKRSNAPEVNENDIVSYFDYLPNLNFLMNRRLYMERC